jgi:site-specific DNA-methyltransferase (adenine-specific)
METCFMLTLEGEKAALFRAYDRALKSYLKHARDCYAVGVSWRNIKKLLTAQRKAGVIKLTIRQWADNPKNAPVKGRWLDEYAEFADRWDEFLAAYKVSQQVPYTSERGKPGLKGYMRLMDWKARYDVYSRARKDAVHGERTKKGKTGTPVPKPDIVTTEGVVEQLTPLNVLICGDAVAAMKVHVPDRSVDVVIADVPYGLSRYKTQMRENYINAFGMKPPINEEWDEFISLADYEQQAEAWIEQIMRCLNCKGSAFIFGVHTNLPLLNRICQVRGEFIVDQIAWTMRNGRPNVTGRTLQHSHQDILWVAKTGEYRFRYHECQEDWHKNDYFSSPGVQERNTWDIPVAPRENTEGHPTPKPLEVYRRILNLRGRPGGTVVDLFTGSGTGAVAAMRWGMHSISIERDRISCAKIRRRVLRELRRRHD